MKDLSTVQGLVAQLLRYDAVTFLTLLEGVRLSQAGSSIWLLHEATHILYEQVRGLAIHVVCAVRHGVFASPRYGAANTCVPPFLSSSLSVHTSRLVECPPRPLSRSWNF